VLGRSVSLTRRSAEPGADPARALSPYFGIDRDPDFVAESPPPPRRAAEAPQPGAWTVVGADDVDHLTRDGAWRGVGGDGRLPSLAISFQPRSWPACARTARVSGAGCGAR